MIFLSLLNVYNLKQIIRGLFRKLSNIFNYAAMERLMTYGWQHYIRHNLPPNQMFSDC